jgi:hypothetical protein
MPTSLTAELCDQAARDVGVMLKAWMVAEGHHREQGQVAAAALAHFLTQTPTLLAVFTADAVLAEAEAAEPVRQIP